ncbi:MAG: hypothetical protein SGARI_002923 [Bacillariaceae sp.]
MLPAATIFFLVLNRFQFLESTISGGLIQLVLQDGQHSSSVKEQPSSTSSLVMASTSRTTRSMASAQAIQSTSDCLSLQTQHLRNKFIQIVQATPDLAGPLIRLAFHDAATYENNGGKATTATGGPNGSIQYELDRYENRALKRPLAVVQNILESMNDDESELPRSCNSTLSLADAIALAGVAAVEAAGGPIIPIRMGRPDVSTSDPTLLRHPSQKGTKRSLVTKTLPEAGLDSDGLRLYFQRLGLSEQEFVALSGVHGMGRHVSLLNMTKDCLKNLTNSCLEEAPVSLPFVTASVDRFDNGYFTALLRWNEQQVELGEVAFIPTDVALVVDSGLRRHVEAFSRDQALFYQVFRRAFQKLLDTTATTTECY